MTEIETSRSALAEGASARTSDFMAAEVLSMREQSLRALLAFVEAAENGAGGTLILTAPATKRDHLEAAYASARFPTGLQIA